MYTIRIFLIFIFSSMIVNAQQTPSEFIKAWVDVYNKNDAKKIVPYYDEAEDMKHRLIGDVTVISFIHKFKYHILKTREYYLIHIRTTATLRKDKDSWKIVSEHSSPIIGIERAKLIKREQAAANQLS